NLGQPRELAGTLRGTLTGHGDAKNPGAEAQITGDQIRFRGLLVERADVEAALEQEKALLKKCRVKFDQDNSIELSGNLDLVDPHAYGANGIVALNDLGAFNGLLRSFGQQGALSGMLKIDLAGGGDAANPAAQLALHGTQLKYRGVLIQTAEIEA